MKIITKLVWGIMVIVGLSLSLFGACANELNMGGKKITNVGTPTNDHEAATKQYVDRGGAVLSESTITHNGLTYGVIYAGGKAWLDRNLGATKVAESSTDTGGYGDLYQWGRATDGHEKRNSGTTTTLSTNDTVGDGINELFIVTGTTEPRNWRDTNRIHFWTRTGIGGITNGICPTGWKVPSEQDFLDLDIINTADAFNKLKLPTSGLRSPHDGNVQDTGHGTYWTSTIDDNEYARYQDFTTNDAYINSHPRGHGFAVRCMKNLR